MSRSQNPKTARPPSHRVAWEWVKSILFAIGLALVIRWPIAEPFKIPSGSMEPTLYDGDRIFVDKHVYGVRWPFNGFRIPFTRTTIWYADSELIPARKPQRWEMAVFKSVEPGAEHDTLVKRIVGLGGERVFIRDGKIYINGEPVTPPGSMPDVYYTRLPGAKYGLVHDDEHTLIPEGHVFLLGDNSQSSRDAREFGWVPEHHLLGRVTSIWWPPSRWRDFTGFTGSLWWNGSLALAAAFILTRIFLGRSWRIFEKSFGGALLRHGDHIFVRFATGLRIPFTQHRYTKGRELKRGEIVLYAPPEAGKSSAAPMFVGIVAGLPEERVFLHNGSVEINDKPLTSQSLARIDFAANGAAGKYGRSKGREYSRVPKDHYFILSDAVPDFPDSRSIGWIPRQQIVGVARFIWWPVRRIRPVSPHRLGPAGSA